MTRVLPLVAIGILVVLRAPEVQHNSLPNGQGATTQTPSLDFQGVVPLTLGMPESAVRQALKEYNVSAVSGSGSRLQNMITTKSGPPFRWLGSVYFENGRLVMATASWPYDGHNDLDLGDTLYRVFAYLSRAGATDRCEISTFGPTILPGVERRSINIRCPATGHGVNVEIDRAQRSSEFATGVAVDEMIFQPR